MALELLFENETQLDDAVIDYILEQSFEKNEKLKRYHLLTLLIGILAAAAGIFFAIQGIMARHMTTIITSFALIVIAGYCFIAFASKTTKNQIKTYKESHRRSWMTPRKIKVFKNVIYQSAGKSHGEYKLYKFTDIQTYDHYFLLRYVENYVIVDKNGFTQGTAEDFEKFMQARIQKNF